MDALTPKAVNRTLRRLANAEYRSREYLTEDEVAQLIDAARQRGRNGARDVAAILLAISSWPPCQRTGEPALVTDRPSAREATCE
jgi:integrase